MGAAESHDAGALHVSSQTALVYSFAIDGSASIVVNDITSQNNYVLNWDHQVGSSDTVVFTVKSPPAKVLGNDAGTGGDPNALDYFAYLSAKLTPGNIVYWVSDTGATINVNNAAASVYSGVTVNNFTLADGGGGGGDPHINPKLNPYNATLILPPNNKIYNYLQYQKCAEKFVINAAMWNLSHDRITFAEELRRDITLKNGLHKTPDKEAILSEAIENITKYPLETGTATRNDPSFIRFLTIIYETQFTTPLRLTVDMETLDVSGTTDSPNVITTDTAPITYPHYNRGEIAFHRKTTDSYMKKLTIKTKKFGNTIITLVRDTNRLNHRNSVAIQFQHNRSEFGTMNGALIHPDRIYTVPTLTTTDFSLFHKEPIPELLSDYKNRNEKRLKERRFQIRDMVRAHDFSLLEAPQEAPSEAS